MLHAVLVGINKYKDSAINTLSHARADAEVFAHVLNNSIDEPDRRTITLLDDQATRRNIMVAIGEELPRLVGPDDIILIYFACHGSPETEQSPDEVSRYLIVHDTEYKSIFATGIDLERDLGRWYSRINQSKLVVLFVDACFSGRAGGRTFEGPTLRQARQRWRSAAPLKLQTLQLGEGRLMFTACDDNQVAREDDAFGHGVFTHYLLQALKRKTAEDETISLHGVYEDVAQRVESYSNGRQTPIINGRSRGAKFPRLIVGE